MDKEKTNEILKRVDDTLKTAKYGLDDLLHEKDERKIAGLRNLITFGRAVTNVLQNLRSVEPDFDEWYAPYQQEMINDPLMKCFYNMRTEILKEGKLDYQNSLYIKSFNTLDTSKFGLPPPNAKGYFIGDQYGNSGWFVEMPNGTTEKYYFDLPSSIGIATIQLPNSPSIHMGKEITDTSINNLSMLYITYLDNLVSAAKTRFLN